MVSDKSNRMIYQTEETRERILSGAQRLFVDQGYAETQMKDIAVAVGISRQSLYRYYQDKTDLGFAVQANVLGGIGRAQESILCELIEAGKWSAREIMVQAPLQLFSQKELELDFRFLAEFDGYNSGARLSEDFLARVGLPLRELKRGVDLYYSLIRRGVNEGSIRDDKPPKQLARLVLYTIQSVSYRMLMRGEALYDLPKTERSRFLTSLCELLEDGLRPR